MNTIFDDLAAEHAAIAAALEPLDEDRWAAPSGCAGWSVSDVLLHLAQGEELAAATVAGDTASFVRPEARSVDAEMDVMVAAERGESGRDVLARWLAAARASVEALRDCPAGARLTWVAMPLSAPTLATTRIAEHWAHALDMTGPLGLPYPDTARLRHIAWLAHRTLPYAFAVAGVEGGPVSLELTGPDGDTWIIGDPAAESRITGPAGEFCRVGARRLAPADTSLIASGPHGRAALDVVRNYAA